MRDNWRDSCLEACCDRTLPSFCLAGVESFSRSRGVVIPERSSDLECFSGYGDVEVLGRSWFELEAEACAAAERAGSMVGWVRKTRSLERSTAAEEYLCLEAMETTQTGQSMRTNQGGNDYIVQSIRS